MEVVERLYVEQQLLDRIAILKGYLAAALAECEMHDSEYEHYTNPELVRLARASLKEFP